MFITRVVRSSSAISSNTTTRSISSVKAIKEVSSLDEITSDPDTPAIIRNYASHWPATTMKFIDFQHHSNPTTTNTNASSSSDPIIVPVEYGGSYMSQNMNTLHLDFNELCSFMQLQDDNDSVSSNGNDDNDDDDDDDFLVINGSGGDVSIYNDRCGNS